MPDLVFAVSGTINAILAGNAGLVQTEIGKTCLTQANTYAGGTRVLAGELVVSNSHGLGTGKVEIEAGVLSLLGGAPIANSVTIAGGMYKVEVMAGGSYAGMANAESSLDGGRDTTVALLDGIAGETTTLSTEFSATSSAFNDDGRTSDVYSFVGTGGDVFVLQLSTVSLAEGSQLAWRNPETNLWVNAVDGNDGSNASVGQMGFQGTFASFQGIYGTDISQYLGAYGVDLTGGDVWAVLNHNSDFAVIPEPSCLSLLIALALLGSLKCVRQKWTGSHGFGRPEERH